MTGIARRRHVVLAFSLCVGCSSREPPSEGGAVPGAGEPAAESRCEGEGFASQEAPVFVEQVTAKVVDTDGNPIADILSLVCGLDLCVNATTDQLGNVRVTPRAALEKPAFKYGGMRYAQFAFRLFGAQSFALGSMTTVSFPGPEMGQHLTFGRAFSSGPVTLELSPETQIEIDQLTYLQESERTFRAAVISGEQATQFEPSLELVIATTPIETRLCPPAKLSLLNLAGWPGGAEVEFLLHGVSIKEEWAPYGGWAVVSQGAVSADGTKLETAPRQGLPMLGVIGVRRANASD